jgi:hypothetical protein
MDAQSAERGAGSHLLRSPAKGVSKMPEPREPQDLPSEDKEIAEEGEKNRRELDKIPEPGSDPLHEGP